MGFFDDLKANKLGRDAYNAHIQANEANRRGKLAEAREKYAEAMRLYGAAYDAGCRRTSVLMGQSVLLMRLGEFARARELMKEISRGGGLSEEAHFELRINYALCLWRLGILDKAIEIAAYAGKYAKNSAYYSAMGIFLVEQARQSGEFSAAQALLDEAMDYDDEDAATLDNCGEFCLVRADAAAQSGDAGAAEALRAQAKDYYERAHRAKPSQVTTLYALARFALEDGEAQRGLELVERAILHSGSKMCPVSAEQLGELQAQLRAAQSQSGEA